jgi:hypothetical protein
VIFGQRWTGIEVFRKCDERGVRSESRATIEVFTSPEHGPPQRILDVPLNKMTLWLVHHIFRVLSRRFIAVVPMRRGFEIAASSMTK